MSPQNYKVEAVHGQSEWEGQYGPMITYNLLANGEDVELNQKPTTPPPTVGQIIYGHTEHGREGFPPKLKKDRREDAGSGASFHAAAAPAAPSQNGPSPDEREKRIVRQHSQHMALLWLHETGGDEIALQKWIDYFEADAFGKSSPPRRPSPASESEAEQGGGVAEDASPPSPISSDDANYLRNRVLEAKLDPGDVIAWLGALGLKNLDQLNERQATVFAKWLDDAESPF